MWNQVIELLSKSYVCGHCGEKVCSQIGYKHHSDPNSHIYICHFCGKPTYFSSEEQVPGPLIGADVRNVPDDIDGLYKEARLSFSVNAFTASIMACRKIIMHIAVSKTATTGLSFQQYVDFLNEKHFIPPDGKEWVDHIRRKGNEANHEIVIMQKDDAEDLIVFIEMLLKLIFEFPSKVKRKAETPK